MAAVHFYPQQKEQEPVRKSHPLRQESEQLAFEKKRRNSFANSTTRSRGSSLRKSSNSIKGDRFIPMRGTDPFQYEHALLRHQKEKKHAPLPEVPQAAQENQSSTASSSDS